MVNMDILAISIHIYNRNNGFVPFHIPRFTTHRNLPQHNPGGNADGHYQCDRLYQHGPDSHLLPLHVFESFPYHVTRRNPSRDRSCAVIFTPIRPWVTKNNLHLSVLFLFLPRFWDGTLRSAVNVPFHFGIGTKKFPFPLIINQRGHELQPSPQSPNFPTQNFAMHFSSSQRKSSAVFKMNTTVNFSLSHCSLTVGR